MDPLQTFKQLNTPLTRSQWIPTTLHQPIPVQPGVAVFYDSEGRVVYVAAMTNLSTRARQLERWMRYKHLLKISGVKYKVIHHTVKLAQCEARLIARLKPHLVVHMPTREQLRQMKSFSNGFVFFGHARKRSNVVVALQSKLDKLDELERQVAQLKAEIGDPALARKQAELLKDELAWSSIEVPNAQE